MFHFVLSNIHFILPYSKNVCKVLNARKIHRKTSKFRNEFAYKDNFKKVFEDIKQVKSNRIMSSDVVLGKKRTKAYLGEGGRVNSNRLVKNISLEYKGELLYGLHPVYLALMRNKRKFHQLFITSTKNSSEETNDKNILLRKEIVNLAQSLNITVRSVSSKELRYLVPDAVHQGVCLDAAHIQLLEWKEIESEMVPNVFPVWLAFDEILDPMNVGAMIRSAYYFGVKKIFTVRGNSCKMSPTVSKASSGALEIMDIYQIENLEYFLKVMISQNWSIVSTRTFDETDCGKLTNALDFQLKGPTILVLGNEGRGVSPTIQALCNNFISIYPSDNLHKGIDSLNVSVATGVILHCLSKSWKDRLK